MVATPLYRFEAPAGTMYRDDFEEFVSAFDPDESDDEEWYWVGGGPSVRVGGVSYNVDRLADLVDVVDGGTVTLDRLDFTSHDLKVNFDKTVVVSGFVDTDPRALADLVAEILDRCSDPRNSRARPLIFRARMVVLFAISTWSTLLLNLFDPSPWLWVPYFILMATGLAVTLAGMFWWDYRFETGIGAPKWTLDFSKTRAEAMVEKAALPVGIWRQMRAPEHRVTVVVAALGVAIATVTTIVITLAI